MKYKQAFANAERCTARQLADRLLSLPVGELLRVWRPGYRMTSIVDVHVDMLMSGSVYVSGRTAGRRDRFRSFFLYDIDGDPFVFGSEQFGRVYTDQRRMQR